MIRHTATLAGVSLTAALLATTAAAQTPPVETAAATPDTGVADIIVTAERREQSVQKAPLTIQVVGGDALARQGVTEAAGLQRLTTGVEIGQGGGNTQIFIRGVGGVSFTHFHPGVAFNVDGVYVGRAERGERQLLRLSRVEVLKGPQGTLYGRNANGGSINLITKDARIGEESVDLCN